MDVGARIVELRTAYHVSQYALWKRSGVPQAAISQYESGKKAPEIDTLERICKGLGVTLADFFSENAPLPPGVTGEERALLESYRVFSPGEQAALRDTLAFWARRKTEARGHSESRADGAIRETDDTREIRERKEIRETRENKKTREKKENQP